ncbi:MAG TPA: YdeI/OmpD-associated family protein [Chthoniobacterales bacterium]|jgi:uncharacterized protein YdeI (YjbR/CyaY-like superfamily)
MPKKNPAVDTYIAQARPFARPILRHLRKIVHAACPNVEEKIKWGSPHFDYKGSLAGMAAFKQHCAFGFWKAALILDPETAQRDDGMGHFGRITKLSDLPNDKALLAYARKAVELNDAGIKLPRKAKPKGPRVLAIPDDLTAALRKNPKARQTFEGFSHSHRKEYVEWITEAKREETRRKRLTTAIGWLAEGKTQNWKYEPKR